MNTKTKNMKTRSSQMKQVKDTEGGSLFKKVKSTNDFTALSPYLNQNDIPWTNISVTLTAVSGPNGKSFLKVNITFSPSSNYTSYSVSDVYQLYDPINYFVRNVYTAYVDGSEKNILLLPGTTLLSLIHDDWIGQVKNENNILFYTPIEAISNTYKYVIVAIKEVGYEKYNKYFFIETSPDGKTRVFN